MQLIAVFAFAAISAAPPAVEHAANANYRALVGEGVTLAGVKVRLPEPKLKESASGEQERQALEEIAGSKSALADFLRKSVTAPQIVKVHDEKAEDGGLIRMADLWFVVYADLGAIEPEKTAKQAEEKGPVEAGNMRVAVHVLTPDEQSGLDLPREKSNDQAERWCARLTGRLLDRIGVVSTDQACATRTDNSVVVASLPAKSTGKDDTTGSRWWAITKKDGEEQKSPAHAYAGGISYVKATRLASQKGAILVEAHFAFSEPREWFNGAPVLRSKISLMAQDQIRHLRRDIEKRQKARDKAGGQR